MLLVLLILLVLAPPTTGYAQQPATNIELLAKTICVDCQQQRPKVALLQTRSGSWLARYNPITLTFTGLMFVYQRYISPQLPSECMYETSCSHFSKNLIKEYGFLKGVIFTADRLTRCNRVAAIDVNPVMINPGSGKIIESVEIYQTP